MYTKCKKRRKKYKKDLQKWLRYGTICERQAMRQKNDFWSLSRKPLKRTNERSNVPVSTEKLLNDLSSENFKSFSKKCLTKNRFCGKIIKSSAARLRRTGPWKLNNIERTCNGTYFRVGKTRETIPNKSNSHRTQAIACWAKQDLTLLSDKYHL